MIDLHSACPKYNRSKINNRNAQVPKSKCPFTPVNVFAQSLHQSIQVQLRLDSLSTHSNTQCSPVFSASSPNGKSSPLPYLRLLNPPHRFLPLKNNLPQQIPPPSPNPPSPHRIIRIHLLRRIHPNIQVNHKSPPTQKTPRNHRLKH